MYPDKTNFSNTQTRSEIIELSRSWMGVPWRHQGRTRNGIDCAGLIIMVGKDIGYFDTDFEISNYSRRTHGYEFLNMFRYYFLEKKNNLLKPGDIIVMRDPVYPCHSGIIGYRYKRPTVIHADTEYREVIEEDLGQSGRINRIIATFEFPGTQKW